MVFTSDLSGNAVRAFRVNKAVAVRVGEAGAVARIVRPVEAARSGLAEGKAGRGIGSQLNVNTVGILR